MCVDKPNCKFFGSTKEYFEEPNSNMMAPKERKEKENSRFSSIQSDPRFILPKKKSIRGEVDSRFKDALNNDERFAKKARIDKYGKKVKAKDVKKELSRYYNFEDDEKSASVKIRKESEQSSNESEETDGDKTSNSSVKFTAPEQKKKLSMRELMRGEGIESSSSESELDGSDESSSDSDLDEREVSEVVVDEYEAVRSAASTVPQGEESRRFAVVNLDWDNVTSTDLMATFSSFVPANKRIISVRIFPSEYGKKKMLSEETNGPAQELFPKNFKERRNIIQNSSVQYDDDLDYSSSHLRKYQLQRLQYYYAVVECDDVSTAAGIYSACDGTEYESSANFFDLRFIPDDVDFSNDVPHDECYKVPASYQPKNFSTDALQHSKVKLTWDETPKERERFARRAFESKDIENDDLKAYLASDSECDEDQASVAERYRALISGENTKQKDNALSESDEDAVEITFNPVLEGKQANLEIVNKSSKSSQGDGPNLEENLSTIDKYRLKEKQRRLRRMENYKARKAMEADSEESKKEADKAELELLALDDDLSAPASSLNNTEENGTKKLRKLSKRASKKKSQEEAEADFDTSDPRFQGLFEDPDFAIDSTLPTYKKTKGMEKILNERRRRKETRTDGGSKRDAPRRASKRRPENSRDSAKQLAAKLRRKSLY